jgi:hypothetical protein
MLRYRNFKNSFGSLSTKIRKKEEACIVREGRNGTKGGNR